MNTIEKRARDLLDLYADPIPVAVEDGRWFMVREQDALDAVRAALTPPEGYVLVPVELPVEMEIAFMEAWVSKRRCIDDPEMQDAWEAALAVRPEVKP